MRNVSVFFTGQLLTLVDEALIQQSQILAFPEPEFYDLTYVQRFLHHKDMNLPFLGPDSGVWGTISNPKNHSPDLITLCPRRKEDPFSGWVVEKAIVNLFRCGCYRFMKPSKVHGVIGYEDTKILRITHWITSIVASLIPILSIVILYIVHSMSARLGIIASFSVLASVCLNTLTSAKRSDIFAITAA